MSFALPALLADIGGTNCRLAILENAGAEAEPLALIPSAEITDLPERLRMICSHYDLRSAVLAVAGVVNSTRVSLTNLPWTIDAGEIGRALQVQSVLLINDFEAQAAATAALQPNALLTLQAGMADERGTRVIVGAGTGFGTAFLRPVDDGFCIIPSEAGHMELPLDEGDEDLFAARLRKLRGHLTIEDVISGPGLPRLDQALHRLRTQRSAMAITDAAEAKNEQALATLAVWQRLLANAVANLVIAAKATGGAWIAGGVITHLLPWIDRQAFTAAFINKPPMTELLQQAPLHIVTRTDSAFPGLAAIAFAPARFGLAQAVGLWRA